MKSDSESKIATAKRIGIIILLGAVGSGVWAGIGEPLLNVAGNMAIRIVGWFSSAYLESMYTEVGKGLYERNASSLHSSISGLFVAFWLIVPFQVYSWRTSLIKKVSGLRVQMKALEDGSAIPATQDDDTPKQVLSTSDRLLRKLLVFFWITIAFTPLAITFQVASLYRNLYTVEAIVFVERSIEILSPKIDTKSIVQLRANYRAISNREQFLALHQELNNYAKTNNVKLPTFSPL